LSYPLDDLSGRARLRHRCVDGQLAPTLILLQNNIFPGYLKGRKIMIGYVTVGTNDLKKAGEFYDKLCGELGMGRFMANDRLIAWGGPGGGAGFGVALPFDGKPMTIGNGVMAAFGAKDKAHVDRIYKLALSLGGSCEGAPGHRSEKFYAAYFRDPEGNKLNAFVMG
jgi:catechol 2,3-dioxygenase-like lactoylglutathione lyase family enzyme